MRLLLTDVNSLLHLFLPSLTYRPWTSKPPSQSQALKPPSPVNSGCPDQPSAGGSRQVDCLPCGSGNGRLYKPRPRRLQPILRLPPADPCPASRGAVIAPTAFRGKKSHGVFSHLRLLRLLPSPPVYARARANGAFREKPQKPQKPLKRQTPAHGGGLTGRGEWPYA